MSVYNTVHLIGRLAKETEIRMTTSGHKVVQFTMCCRRNKDVTDFIPCVAWDRTAVAINMYIHKGSMFGAEGTIQTRNYEDQNGNKRYITEVRVSNIVFVESNKANNTAQTDSSVVSDNETNFTDQIIDSDDLPF